MNYIQKNKQNIIIAAIGVIVLILLAAFWFQRSVITSNEIDAEVKEPYVKVGEAITFKDKTPFARSVNWDFGDGTTSTKPSGTHIYNKADYYTVVLTINNKEKKTWNILVSEGNIQPRMMGPDAIDSTATTIIDAPSSAMQLELVPFKAISKNAKKFSWQFGETGRVDSQEKTAYYDYKKAGTYVVTLRTDDSDIPITHNIVINKAYSKNDDEILAGPATGGPAAGVDNSAQKAADDFKIRLQRIANGDFKSNYDYLVRKYLCGKERIPATTNGANETSFYYYCTGLQFGSKKVIQEVKLTFDSSQNCVVKVEVMQSE